MRDRGLGRARRSGSTECALLASRGDARRRAPITSRGAAAARMARK